MTPSALQLDEALDLVAAKPLAKSLLERRGASIVIDASLGPARRRAMRAGALERRLDVDR